MLDLITTTCSVLGAGFIWLLLSPRIAERLYGRALFEPLKFPAGDWSSQAGFDREAEDVWFLNNKRQKLHGWFFSHPTSATTVIVNHGNSGNIADLYVLISLLLRLPINLFIYDYRGFGKSEGSPMTREVCEDAVSAYDYMAKRLPSSQLVLYGESIGGGISCYVAQRRKVSGLILQSAFYDMRRISSEFYAVFKIWPRALFPVPFLDNATALGKLSCPVLIVHGEKDREVGVEHSRDLFACANKPKELTILPHTSHEEIAPEDFDLYMSSLEQFIGQFQPVAPKAMPSLALV
jgi:fermentation-respiration switch protein FrsA (DUF1100 family)